MDHSQTESKIGPTTSLEPADVQAVKAHQRAPTLMAGAAGRQGSVQVWSPRPALAYARFLGVTVVQVCWLPLFLAVCVGAFMHPPLMGFLPAWFVRLGVVFVAASSIGRYTSGWRTALQSLRHPCYISADEEGIAVIARTGSRAVLWRDVRSSGIQDNILTLQLWSGDKIQANLLGYPRRSRATLLELINSRSNKTVGGYEPLNSRVLREPADEGAGPNSQPGGALTKEDEK